MENNTIEIPAHLAQEAQEKLEDADIGFVMTEGDDNYTFEFMDSMDLRDADQILKGLIE
jgi:hypothetical protein